MASRSDYIREFQIKFQKSFADLIIFYNELGYWPSIFFTAFLVLTLCGFLSTLMRIISLCFKTCSSLFGSCRYLTVSYGILAYFLC